MQILHLQGVSIPNRRQPFIATPTSQPLTRLTLSGANRNIYEATVGYGYRLIGGEYGRIERGNQVVHVKRNLWSGAGTAPQVRISWPSPRLAFICRSFAGRERAACEHDADCVAAIVLLQRIVQLA